MGPLIAMTDPGFPRGLRGTNPGQGVPTYYLANFFNQKVHEIERILTATD